MASLRFYFSTRLAKIATKASYKHMRSLREKHLIVACIQYDVNYELQTGFN